MLPQYPLYTVGVVDDHYNVCPTAWMISEGEKQQDLLPFLQALKRAVELQHPGWRPSCFIVDDCDAQTNALKAVFGQDVPVNLCTWHVKRAWLKHLLQLVKDAVERWDMLKELSQIMIKPRPRELTVRAGQHSGISCLLQVGCGMRA